MSKRIILASTFAAALAGSSLVAWSHERHCAWLQGWGSADNLGTAKAAATLDLTVRTEGWVNRHRARGYEYCDGPDMHCHAKGGVHTCTNKAQACLK